MDNKGFLKSKGDYRGLIVFKKAECIYDLTYHFAHRFLRRGDRTIDQMVQEARSGKQNIIEGSAASLTSRETEIKLYNVAKASFDELLADYEDYLRVRGISRWNEEKNTKVREFCRHNNDSGFYRGLAPNRDDATLANLCITLIHQELFLLIRLIEKSKTGFSQQWRNPGRDEQGAQGTSGERSQSGQERIMRRIGGIGNNGRIGRFGRIRLSGVQVLIP